MPGASDKPVTQLLLDWRRGRSGALDELIALVYDDLRRQARRVMRRERPGHTLRPTALVAEAYLRLCEAPRIDWKDRSHFFAVAARVMRRVLVEHARARKAGKRGGGATLLSLDEALDAPAARGLDFEALEDALGRLEALDERQARIVELRFFGGLTIEETAEALDASPATVKREWAAARVWLYSELRPT